MTTSPERTSPLDQAINTLHAYAQTAQSEAQSEGIFLCVYKIKAEVARLTAAKDAAEAERDAARTVVEQQAADSGLWFVPRTAAEAYLQQELRRLHYVVESSTTNGQADFVADLQEPTKTHLGWLLAKVINDASYPEARGLWQVYCDWIDATKSQRISTTRVSSLHSDADR